MARFVTGFKDISPLFAFLALIVSFSTLLLTFYWVKPDVRAIRAPHYRFPTFRRAASFGLNLERQSLILVDRWML